MIDDAYDMPTETKPATAATAARRIEALEVMLDDERADREVLRGGGGQQHAAWWGNS
jgi:hypothetical protein